MASSTRLLEFKRRQSLAFGIEWQTTSGLRELGVERRTLLREAKASHVITLEQAQKRPLIGIARGLPRSARAYSAALLLARHMGKGGAVLACSLGKNVCGVVGVRNGQPVVGFDEAGTPELIRAKVSEFVRTFNEPVQLFTWGVHVDGAQELNPVALFGQSEALKTARLSPATLPLKLVATLATTFFAAGVGFFGYNYWQQQKAEEMRQQQMKAKPVDYNRLYEDAIKGNLLSTGPRAEGLPELMRTVRAMPAVHEGWWLDSVHCRPGICQTHWKVDNGTSDAFFTHPIPGTGTPQFDPDFKGLSLDFQASPLTDWQGIQQDALLDETTFMRQMGTLSQETTDAEKEFSVTQASITALPAGAVEAQIRHPVKSGTWKLAGKLWVGDFASHFPPGFTVDELSISVPQGNPESTSIEIKGKYFVKN
jgi:hypothetical protein